MASGKHYILKINFYIEKEERKREKGERERVRKEGRELGRKGGRKESYSMKLPAAQ